MTCLQRAPTLLRGPKRTTSCRGFGRKIVETFVFQVLDGFYQSGWALNDRDQMGTPSFHLDPSPLTALLNEADKRADLGGPLGDER